MTQTTEPTTASDLDAVIMERVNRIGRLVMTQIAIAQQHETSVDHQAVECHMCDSHLLALRESVYDELKAYGEHQRRLGYAQGVGDAAEELDLADEELTEGQHRVIGRLIRRAEAKNEGTT